MSILVEVVVGQFNLLEGDVVFHPLGPCGGWVTVNEELGLELGLGFSGNRPLLASEFVSAVVSQNQVKEDEVFGLGVQALHIDFQSGEHSPKIRDQKIENIW